MAETQPKKRGRRASSRPAGSRRANSDELRRQLDAAEARYRALTEKLPLTTYTAALDVQAAFTYLSPQVEALLGFAPEEWISDTRLWFRRLHPEDRSRVILRLVRAHSGGRPFAEEYRLLDKAGRAHWIRDESHVVRAKGGRPLFIQGTWTEITRRKELEHESAGQERELAASKAELEQLVSVASHELNAPLRRIINLGDLLLRRCRERLGAEEGDMLDRVVGSAAEMQRLVAALGAFVETGREAALEATDFQAAAEQALHELRGAVVSAGAEVTVGPLPKARANPALAATVLRNLLDNALKFRSARPPRIHVSAARTDGEWTISVRDNGIGIDPRQAERVFSVFSRLHPPKQYPGVGLGLAVCKRIVESFGGRIWAASEPGEGSTFSFTVPA